MRLLFFVVLRSATDSVVVPEIPAAHRLTHGSAFRHVVGISALTGAPLPRSAQYCFQRSSPK